MLLLILCPFFLFRTVFGVTTVPVVKPVMLAGDTTPSGVSKQHFYEGIKVRPKPIPVHVEGTDTLPVGTTPLDKKRPIKPKRATTVSAGPAPVVSSTSLESNADPGPPTLTTSSTTSFTPTSSILLSQLSAPPKPKDTPSTLENANQVRMDLYYSFILVMG